MKSRTNPQLMLDGFTLEDMEAEAIAYLREHEPTDGYSVGFSGGKDSIVTLDLVRRSGVRHHAHFAMSYIDPPEVLLFIRKHYPTVEWRRPRMNIYEGILIHGLPGVRRRWCCALIKEGSKDKNVVVGVRAEESVRRASRPRTDFITKQKKMMYKPVFHWDEWAIWEYIDKYNLPYPDLYDNGETRLGCVVCPFAFGTSERATSKIKRSQERYPGIWRAYKNAAKQYYDKKATVRPWEYTFDAWWNAFLRGWTK